MNDIQSITLDEIASILRQDATISTRKDTVLDAMHRSAPAGSIQSATSSAFYGFNLFGTPGGVPINKDFHGYTFFTRPDLNMAKNNLRSSRYFNQLLTNDPNSIQRAIRVMLDPRLGFRNTGENSNLFNNRQAFMPILSNTLVSFGGVPDLAAQYYTTPQGVMKESMSWIDGVLHNNSTYNISLTFRNSPGSPVIQLIYYWMLYASMVYMGDLMPYPDNVKNTRIDYMTRIYRVVTDESKRYVRNIWACGAAFPESCPIGALFNFEADHPFNNSLEQFSISFQCMLSMPFDEKIIEEFNRVQWQYFNPSFHPDRRSASYVKLQPTEYEFYNYTAFPYINPDTMEMEWWCDKTEYNKLRQQLLSLQGIAS